MAGPYWQTQWNPVSGCSHAGTPGCDRCWAREMHNRFHPCVPFEPTLHHEALSKPLHWRKPRTVFVCNTGDLFHKDVPDTFIERVFAIMHLCPQHTFLVLTKRAERMRQWVASHTMQMCLAEWTVNGAKLPERTEDRAMKNLPAGWDWPPRNCWLGVTAEDQQRADERIPLLLATPAAHRWVSFEPLLENIVCNQEWLGPGAVEQIIPGAESGRGMRPCPPTAVPLLMRQAQIRGAKCFIKQLHINGKLVTDPALFPEGLRVRELAWREE